MEYVVITGADGFIGSHLVSFFSSKNIRVYALIMPNSPTRYRIENIKNVIIQEVNFNNLLEYKDKLPMNPLAFFHFAWAGVAPQDREDTILQFNNVKLSLDTVELAASIKAQKYIFPGSTMEYTNCNGPIEEKSLPDPQNAYGAAKLSAKYFCKLACEKKGISYIYCVLSSIYASDRIDNNIIYYTITKLLNQEKPSFTKLEQLWDYVYIDDVVEAFYLIAINNNLRSFYTIGSGDNWPLSKYINIVRNLINKDLPLGIGDIPYKNGLIPMSCIDITALSEDTGYYPKVKFEDGITRVIDEIKKRMEKNRSFKG